MTHQPFLELPMADRIAINEGKRSGLALPEDVFAPVNKVLRTFNSLRNDDARAAFADEWLAVMSDALDEAWPAIYELGRIVKEKKIYEPNPVRESRKMLTTNTFEEYWQRRMGKPFETWLELEETYHFAKTAAPKLLGGSYSDARVARNAALVESTEAAKEHGGTKGNKNAAKKAIENECANSTSVFEPKKTRGSTKADYLVARIKRDAPEIAERLAKGEIRSVRAAAIEAGIIKVPTDEEKAAKLLAKLTPEVRGKVVESSNTSGSDHAANIEPSASVKKADPNLPNITENQIVDWFLYSSKEDVKRALVRVRQACAVKQIFSWYEEG